MTLRAMKIRIAVLVMVGLGATIFLLATSTSISSPTIPDQFIGEIRESPQKRKETANLAYPGKGDCKGNKKEEQWKEGVPPLYIITPTYPRAEQIPEITRTAQTLLNVDNVVWIVSEDAVSPTQGLLEYLDQSPLKSVYLRVQMPPKYWKVKNKPRGVANRMAGLNWIRKNAKEGVLYFADDDNSYDIRIFEQMRWTQKVSMFPVGLVTKLGVSSPIVKEGKVVGFYDGWIAKRKFPVDMAGFAVSVPFLLSKPNASMPFVVGYEEDGFIKSLGITSAEIEPLAYNCTKIWVWHTQTKKNKAADPVAQNNITMGSNLDVLKNLLWKDNNPQTQTNNKNKNNSKKSDSKAKKS